MKTIILNPILKKIKNCYILERHIQIEKKILWDCFWPVISIIYLNTIGKSVERFLNGSWDFSHAFLKIPKNREMNDSSVQIDSLLSLAL